MLKPVFLSIPPFHWENCRGVDFGGAKGGWVGTVGSELTPVIPTWGLLLAWSARFNRHHVMTSFVYKRRIEGQRTMCPSASTHEDTLSGWTHTISPASSQQLSMQKYTYAHTRTHTHTCCWSSELYKSNAASFQLTWYKMAYGLTVCSVSAARISQAESPMDISYICRALLYFWNSVEHRYYPHPIA